MKFQRNWGVQYNFREHEDVQMGCGTVDTVSTKVIIKWMYIVQCIDAWMLRDFVTWLGGA